MNAWRLLGLDLAPGTITDGLRRLEILLRPIYEGRASSGILRGICIRAMRRGGRCSSPGKARSHGWWLWVVKGLDTVI